MKRKKLDRTISQREAVHSYYPCMDMASGSSRLNPRRSQSISAQFHRRRIIHNSTKEALFELRLSRAKMYTTGSSVAPSYILAIDSKKKLFGYLIGWDRIRCSLIQSAARVIPRRLAASVCEEVRSIACLIIWRSMVRKYSRRFKPSGGIESCGTVAFRMIFQSSTSFRNANRLRVERSQEAG